MTYTGQKVNHELWGTGTIISQEGTKLVVEFKDFEKTFSCPSCFEKFLTILDPKIAAIAKAEAKKDKAKKDASKKEEAERKKRQNEMLQKDRESNSDNKSSVKISETFVKRFNNVEDFVDYYNQALSEEISYIRTKGGKRIRLTDGKYIENSKSVYLYSFEADSEYFFPDGMEIRIYYAGRNFLGTIVTCDDFYLTISSSIFIGKEVSTVKISADPWQLLAALQDRMEELKDNPSPIVKKIICEGYNNIIPGDILTGQENALSNARSLPVSFIWGPPGTGKTETLAKIALDCIEKGQSVLMLSYSNVSVDGATLRVDKLKESYVGGEILRYGYARDSALDGERCLASYEYTIRKNHKLYEHYKSLQSESEKANKKTVEYVEIKKQLEEIRKSIKEEEAKAVSTAKFIATTVSKAVVDPVIYEKDYDVVIFDEASMAYIPQVVYAASLARHHFVCIGDFSQLPPIVQSNNSVLNCDIFAYCGVSKAVESNKNHLWLCMLNTQYRMHKSISDFVGKNMYRSKLLTAPEIIDERNSLAQYHPMSGKPISIVDISNMVSICTTTTDKSHINPLSALVTFGFALKAAKNQEVGIISPYAAQARLYRAMARDAAEALPNFKPITCATVHQFQGSQKDIIFFDAVDCYLQRCPGVLLSSQSNNTANRLFNVAMTRSRGKFVGVANVDYMAKNLSSKIMLRKLISYCKSYGILVGGNQFKSEIGTAFYNFYRLQNAEDDIEEFFLDLENAKQTIAIDIPDEMKNDSIFVHKFADVLKAAKTRGVKVTLRSNKLDSLPETIKFFASRYDYLYNPVTVIDKKNVWYGLPYCENDFTLKNGKKIEALYRPIIRIQGKKTANALMNFLGMNS